MRIVTFDEVTAHCKLNDLLPDEEQNAADTRDYASERMMLEMYADSAEETVMNYLNRTLESIFEEHGKMPCAIKHAVMLLTAEGYKNRENSSPTQLHRVSYNVQEMLRPYRWLV